MPTIQCAFQDIKTMYGKKCSVDELKEWLFAAKAELEQYDEKTDMLTIKLGDTNQPYLWSAEGLGRFLCHYKGSSRGIPPLKLVKTKNCILVDQKLEKIRPCIAAFVAVGKPLTEYLLKQFIQLQEKIAESFGRRRQKVAIGLYPSTKITFPLRYYAADPEKTGFVPLDGAAKENLRRILAYHPKGKEYAWILKDAKAYPVIEDASGKILSFPPIINSEETGRICIGDNALFFEATGNDFAAVLLATTIFAYAFADRGFSIQQVIIDSHNRKIETPLLKEEKLVVTPEMVTRRLGLSLSKHEMKELLERAQYAPTGNTVVVPPYRGDVLHAVDVIEDIGIMYGYDNIKPLPLTAYTMGHVPEKVHTIGYCRELLAGLGYQEILSPFLTNIELLSEKMNTPASGVVEIDNSMSQTYSVVRTWLLPILLDVLAKNKHVDYPQRIFEQGIATRRVGDECRDAEKISWVSCHHAADYTEAKQTVDYLLSALGVSYSISPGDHPAFISGRVGDVIVNKKKIGFLGEINPVVLENMSLDMPVAGVELNLSEIMAGKTGGKQ